MRKIYTYSQTTGGLNPEFEKPKWILLSFQYIRTGKKEFLNLVIALTLHIDIHRRKNHPKCCFSEKLYFQVVFWIFLLGSMWRVKTDFIFKNSFFPVLIYWSDIRIHLGFSNSGFSPPPIPINLSLTILHPLPSTNLSSLHTNNWIPITNWISQTIINRQPSLINFN